MVDIYGRLGLAAGASFAEIAASLCPDIDPECALCDGICDEVSADYTRCWIVALLEAVTGRRTAPAIQLDDLTIMYRVPRYLMPHALVQLQHDDPFDESSPAYWAVYGFIHTQRAYLRTDGVLQALPCHLLEAAHKHATAQAAFDAIARWAASGRPEMCCPCDKIGRQYCEHGIEG